MKEKSKSRTHLKSNEEKQEEATVSQFVGKNLGGRRLGSSCPRWPIV